MDPFGEAENAFEENQNTAFPSEESHTSDYISSIDQAELQAHSSCDSAPGCDQGTLFLPNDSIIDSPDVEEDELTKYNYEWEEKLAKKASEQSRIAIECKEKALADMEQFIAEREHIMESKKTTNRAHEQAMLEKLQADLANANPWERVVTLVDMKQPKKTNKSDSTKKSDKDKKSTEILSKSTTDEITTDVSRMRQMFLQLKREPLETTRSIATH